MVARVGTMVLARRGLLRIANCGAAASWLLACTPGMWGRADSGPAVAARTCQEHCTATPDCQTSWECRAGRCVAPTTGGNSCGSDDDCQIAASGWTDHECDAGADCPGQVCVAFSGTHYCAIQPSANVDCGRLHMTEMQLTQLGGSAVTVCANIEWQCESSTCVFRCSGDTSCSGVLPACDTNSGDCQCRSSPDSCGPNMAGGAVCVRGVCGCHEDKDCVGAGYDKCYGGRCGCSASPACDDFAKLHPGTSVVCE